MSLRHVRWIAGGTGAGKSTVARLLERRLGAVVYDGDRAEHGWLPRCTQQEHPHLYAGLRLTKSERAAQSPEEKFHGSASLHGETIGFLVEDLLAMPADRPVLVDWFGVMPRYVAPLLSRPEHAVFLLPTNEFREQALRARFSDPDRARANWGSLDTSVALANRLGRDELWVAEVRRQARDAGLPVIDIDGTRDPESVADELAANFQSS
ncbi:hypothetical protein [Actinophytocola sp. NPDC049390]|uniref:hypothetical protein n=1 Tax=Actinophytocola sp. NPDC049390 TaxID=3363894 RepID=UPI0037B9E529